MQPDVTAKEEKRVEEVDHVEGDIALQSRRILKEHHFPPSWRVAWLGIFCQGFSVSVDIVLRKKLAEDPRYGRDVAIAVDDVKEVGHIMGYVVGSVLMQATGRVTALYLYGVGVVFGTLATVLCTTLPHVPTAFLICVFQAVAGVFGAVGSLTGYVYLSEVAPDEDRGIVAGIEHCCYLLGRLVANMFPSALPWQWLAVLSLAQSLLFVFLMRWTIESPRWFLQVDRLTEAQHAYDLLGIAVTGDQCAISAIRVQRIRTPCKAMVCAIFVFWLRTLGGPSGVRKFRELHLVGSNDIFFGQKDLIMAIFQISIMPGIIFLMDSLGRRFLLYTSSVILTVILWMSAYLVSRTIYAESLTENATFERAVMCAALCSVLANSVGVGPVSFLLCTELLPPRRHGLLAGFLYSGVRALFFLFRWSMRSDTYQVVYFAVAGASAGVSLLVLIFLLPETKLLPLDRIPSLFSSDPRVRQAAARTPESAGGSHELLEKQALHEFPLRDFADTYKPPEFVEDTSTTTSTPE
ncbi:solute carrier family 2, facilitated glucose transporter member 8-like [Rhipicephalus microplus]|uniref:solute carrier family 2, facilitated glucose transporter member 8-like n=1 Tax=Rhipicephalus microplus TaxID=6941 RepID=UPI003F6D4629